MMRRFAFVSCVNRPEIARRDLLTSPCLQVEAGHQLILIGQASSAGDGMRMGLSVAQHDWLVMLHQDVHLPLGWDRGFGQALDAALTRYPNVAVVGVYGVQPDGTHVGHVYDRDRWLGAPQDSACPVRSLDELLLAVRVDSGLCADPHLGWHLYGTDLCLAAHARGLEALVVHAPCEHRSDLPRLEETHTPTERAALQSRLQPVAQAYGRSADALLRRWPHAAPIHTTVTTLTTGVAWAKGGFWSFSK